MTEISHRSDFKLDNRPPKSANIIFSKLGACAETISSWFGVLFTISRFLIFKSATDPISIENSLSAEIRQVIDFRELKSDRWQISVMEIGSLTGLLRVNEPFTLVILDVYGPTGEFVLAYLFSV
jgi:hypothetical protein